jgi:SAM-dependent methyltransferase
MRSWREFWDSNHAIYVNETHKKAHQTAIKQDLNLLYTPKNVVLDYGCGETPLIENASALYLVEGAPLLLQKLQATYGDYALAPEALETLPKAHFDRIFMVSVLQYLSPSEFETRLANFHTLLKPQGIFYIGDVIDPATGMVQDALSLLTMGLKEGFFSAAFLGLVKTALSPYRHLRAKLGFTRLCEAELTSLLHKHGFIVERAARNIGPHQHRYTVKATKK